MKIFQNNQKTGFHLNSLDRQLPITLISLMIVILASFCYIYGYYEDVAYTLFQYGVCSIIFKTFCWSRYLVRKAAYESKDITALREDALTFIVFKSIIFISFFWIFFYFSFGLYLDINKGAVWPSAFMIILDPSKVPPLNIFFIIALGVSVNWAYHGSVYEFDLEAIIALVFTIMLAIVSFNVFIGTCFLVVWLIRVYLNHFTLDSSFGLEASPLYWHFVDVLWLFLFVSFYYHAGL